VSDAALSAPDKDARIAELEAALATAHADITARDILIDTLRVQLARLKRMQFGKASEKLTHEIAQLELALEELEAEAATVSARRADPAGSTGRHPFGCSRPICRVKNSALSPSMATARAQIAAAPCALWVRIATRCSTPCRSSGGSSARSAPSIAAAPPRRSCRQQHL
jgi:hypothetical protein